VSRLPVVTGEKTVRTLAKAGFSVIGIERKKERVDMVNEGKTYHILVSLK